MAADLECLCEQLTCGRLNLEDTVSLMGRVLCCIAENTTPGDPVDEVVEDCEIVCASTDGRPLLLKITKAADGTVTTELTEIDGSAVADGATAAACDAPELEEVEFCFQDPTDPSIRYTLVNFVDPSDGSVVTSVWFDSTGAPVAAPAGVVPCVDEAPCVPAGEACYDDGTDQGKAIRLIQKQSDGTFVVTFIDSLTGAVVDSSDVIPEPCGEVIVTSTKHCVIP